jgi:drug/metabolite transporter (DMT)-like permease
LVTGAADASAVDRSARGSRRDLGLASLGAFSFGCTVLFSRTVARDQLAPSVALGIRFGVAGVLLLGLLAVLRRPILPPSGDRLAAVALGLFVYAIESTFFYMGLQRGTAAAVALIFYAYPAVIALAETVAGAIRLRARAVVALVLSISGSAVVAVGGGRVAITATGVLLVCGSIVMFSAYALLSDRVLPRTDSLTAATWTAIGASIGVTLFGAARGQLELPSGHAFAALVANGVATAAAFTLFFMVLGRIGPTRTGICMALEAVTGIVLAAIFLGESVRPIVAIGGVAVLSGAVLAALVSPAPIEALERSSPP